MEKQKRTSFNIEPSKWEDFKKVAKLKQSDANKELRKFVDKYLKENKDILLKEKE